LSSSTGASHPFGVRLDGSAPGDLAGSVLATGQFGTAGGAGTGLSGKQDLAIGLPGAISGAGVVDVYRFGQIGSAFSQRFDELSLSRTIEAGDHFGAALAAGNFGRGSLDDLAVGAPQEDIEASSAADAGVVGVFHGQNNTLVTTGSQVIDQENAGFGTIEAGDQFGAALATGDFGKTSVADLAIGSPTEDIGTGPGAQVDAGVIGFIYGDSTNGLTNAGAGSGSPSRTSTTGLPTAPSSGLRWPRAISAPVRRMISPRAFHCSRSSRASPRTAALAWSASSTAGPTGSHKASAHPT
jgi:hypothetical protein